MENNQFKNKDLKYKFTVNSIDIIHLGPKGDLTILKHVYKIKRNIYIYWVKKFFLYPMWNIIKIVIYI